MKDFVKQLLISVFLLIINFFKPKPKPDPEPIPDNPVVIVVDPEPVVIIPTPLPIPPKPVPPIPTPIPVPIPPEPTPTNEIPGDKVKWFTLDVQRSDQNATWGPFLTDVHNHLPKQYGNQYFDNDRVTHCHETTHGINSHVSNLHNQSGRGNYGFYVGNGKYCILIQPKVTLAQVATNIPANLRGTRYNLYLIQQQKDWGKDPLYIFDEFLAYVNGATTGLDIASSLTGNGSSDIMIGPLEFSIYSLFLTNTILQNDPNYDMTDYKEFLAHSLRRAFSVYRKGISLRPFQWDNKLEIELMKNETCKNVLKTLYGDKLTLEMMLK